VIFIQAILQNRSEKQNQVNLQFTDNLHASVIFLQAILQNRSPDLVTRENQKGGKLSNNYIVFGQFLSSVKNIVKILRFDLVLFMIRQTDK